MSITLYTDSSEGPHKEFNAETRNLYEEGKFNLAQVTSGTWFLYKHVDFNKKPEQSQKNNILILEEGTGLIDISNVNGSLYLLPNEKIGIVLFEHFYYGGFRIHYDGPGCENVTTLFPEGEVGGVSSAIVLDVSGKWEVFSKKGYKGLKNELLPSRRYATPAEMNFPNDTVQSIRKK